MTKFHKVDPNKFKVINISNLTDSVETQDPLIDQKKTFVLGVLSTIDQAKSKEEAIFIISRVASEIFFNKSIEFQYFSN